MSKLPIAKFNLRKPKANNETLISLVYRYRGKRVVYSTGYSILPSEWNFNHQRPFEKENRNDLFLIYRKLDELAKYCKSIFIESNYGNISVKSFKIKLTKYISGNPYNSKVLSKNKAKVGFFDFMDLELEEMKLTGTKKSTLKSIKLHIGIIKRFGHFDYEDVDWNFRLKFVDYLSNNNFQLAYGNKCLKILKFFLERSRRKKLHTNNAYQGRGWTIPRTRAKGDLVTLSSTELKRLASVKLSGHLEKIRDVLIIGACTGQRFSDFAKYSPEQFSISEKGVPLLSIISEKTSTPTHIPLNIFEYLVPILEKHNYKTPTISMQKFNEGLKVLAELVELSEKVLVVEQYMGRKARIEKYYIEKHKVISSHVCRRSFCTILYKMGIPISKIAMITGHSNESQLMNYIGLNIEQNAEEVGLLFL